jgi:hypothetical protein
MPCACHSEGASQPQGLGRNAADLNPAKSCPRNEYPMMMMMSFIVLSETNLACRYIPVWARYSVYGCGLAQVVVSAKNK